MPLLAAEAAPKASYRSIKMFETGFLMECACSEVELLLDLEEAIIDLFR